MVLQRVPPQIAARLRNALKKERIKTKQRFPTRAENFMLKLPSADHRSPDSKRHRLVIKESAEYRVREMRIKGTNGLILKLAENKSAIIDIRFVRRMVQLINNTYPNKFILLKPKASPVGSL